MKRIAICEDEHNQQEIIKHLLNSYAKKNELLFSIKTYNNTSQLLDEADEVDPYDLYLLDIYLPDDTGISLAKKLFQKNITSPLIFITTSREHALDAYTVNAIQYLLKPLEEQAFFSAIDIAIQRTEYEKRKYIILKCNGQLHTISTNDIIYTEAYGHNQIIYLTTHETLSVRMSVNELYTKLIASPKFVRCGSSYILNMGNIQTLHPKMVTMINGATIPIPRGSYAELKTQYFEYYSEI